MKKLTLINGQQIKVVEETIQGMAGEPMDIVRFKDEKGETVHFNDFKKLLCYFDFGVIELVPECHRYSECNYDFNIITK